MKPYRRRKLLKGKRRQSPFVDDLAMHQLSINLYSDTLGPVLIKPTIGEFIAFTDMVFPDKLITDHMETGYIYEYGVANMVEEFHTACYLVKLYVDKTTLPTADIDADDEHTACFVIPAETMLAWAEPNKEN